MAGIDLNTEVRALAAVAAGGALGAPARYGVAQLIHTAPLASGGFAWATFWTNVSGSFALGLILMLAFRWLPMSLHLRRFLTTGFLGAFTTFSTFVVETDLLVKDGHAGVGVIYATASLVAGMAAVGFGMFVGRRV